MTVPLEVQRHQRAQVRQRQPGHAVLRQRLFRHPEDQAVPQRRQQRAGRARQVVLPVRRQQGDGVAHQPAVQVDEPGRPVSVAVTQDHRQERRERGLDGRDLPARNQLRQRLPGHQRHHLAGIADQAAVGVGDRREQERRDLLQAVAKQERVGQQGNQRIGIEQRVELALHRGRQGKPGAHCVRHGDPDQPAGRVLQPQPDRLQAAGELTALRLGSALRRGAKQAVVVDVPAGDAVVLVTQHQHPDRIEQGEQRFGPPARVEAAHRVAAAHHRHRREAGQAQAHPVRMLLDRAVDQERQGMQRSKPFPSARPGVTGGRLAWGRIAHNTGWAGRAGRRPPPERGAARQVTVRACGQGE